VACEDKKAAFEAAISTAAQALKDGLAAVAADAETKAKGISDEFEAGNDLAQGVGAVAGTVVGGILGGPAGAAAGGSVGKAIGALFVIKVEMHEASFSLDVPEVAMRDQRWSFDAPTVTMQDREMSFDLPVIEMVRRRGPDIPRTVCRMETREGPFGIKFDVPVCYIEMEATYLDVPETRMQRQRVVLGLPEVQMERQEIVVGVPEITMRTQRMSFHVPRIVLEFVQDAGKKAADAAASLAQEAQVAAASKEAALREQLRFAAAGPCNAMFDCYRGELQAARDQVILMFDPQIQQISLSIQTALSRGIAEADASIAALRETLQRVTSDRDRALAGVDAALAQLNEAANKALDQFINKDD